MVGYVELHFASVANYEKRLRCKSIDTVVNKRLATYSIFKCCILLINNQNSLQKSKGYSKFVTIVS